MENFNIVGYYFNNHYSTSAYVLYYLVRVNPYTYLHIDFQSNKFDVSERLFNNYNSYSYGVLYSSENRELIPEFFHFFEICLNLNYNYFGKMNYSDDVVNNFNSNKYKTCIEFIINQRILLEKENIVPWINNIFGCNQLNDSKEIMNLFHLNSYEQKFEINLQNINDEDDFNKYQKIRSLISNLDIGITPIQLFKTPHPEKNTDDNNNNELNISRIESFSSSNSQESRKKSAVSINDINNKKEKKEEKKLKVNENKISKYLPEIKSFTFNQITTKYKIFLNETTMNLFFIFDDKIIIYNLINLSKSDSLPKIKYPIELSLKNKLFVEMIIKQ